MAALQRGWLAPGSYVLQLLENQALTLEEVLRRPKALHQKWFGEMRHQEKARWIARLRSACTWYQLQALLELSPRRLQQLRRAQA